MLLTSPLWLLVVVAAIFGAAPDGFASGPLRYGVSAFALKDIPPLYLRWYQRAQAVYGVDWALIAGIGKVETDHGRSTAPGVRNGLNAYGCCAGPMQFFTNRTMAGGPTTWDTYGVDGNHDGTTDVYNPADAIMAAGNYLKALGATTNPRQAVFGYNHAWWYVAQVEAWARKYRGPLLTTNCSPACDMLSTAGPPCCPPTTKTT